MNLRPVNHIQRFSKIYPNAWQIVNTYYHAMYCRSVDFPNWCFLPSDLFYHIGVIELSMHTDDDLLDDDLIDDISPLMAFSKWRITQGIYRFDPTIEQAVINSTLKGNLPVEAFYKLPEWCIYVETNDTTLFGEKVYGFFVHLGYHNGRKLRELRILLDSERGLVPCNILLGPWSLKEAIDKLFVIGQFAETLPDSFDMNQICSDFAEAITPFLTLILYLCSEKPDYSGALVQAAYPSPKKTKQGLKFFPPEKPKIIEVGKTIGQQLRTQTSSIASSTGSRTVKPHIRRGHWHHYRKGKRNGNNQELIVVWLPPIAVNADDFLISGWDEIAA